MKLAARQLTRAWLVTFGTALLSLSQLGCQPIVIGNRLTVASAGKISSLDPAQASTVNTIQLLSALGDPLYSLDGNGELIPRLAEASPIVSPDGLTVTIPLRRDVLFHDGTRFDAEAMAFSLRRFLEIGTLSYVMGGRIRSVEVAADHQIVLRLSRPPPLWRVC